MSIATALWSFYSHVIYLGTKILFHYLFPVSLFYSHVIYLGTKIDENGKEITGMFYSHVIYLGTKIEIQVILNSLGFTVT